MQCFAPTYKLRSGQSLESLEVTTGRFMILNGNGCQLTAMIPYTHALHVHVRGPVHLATHAQ